MTKLRILLLIGSVLGMNCSWSQGTVGNGGGSMSLHHFVMMGKSDALSKESRFLVTSYQHKDGDDHFSSPKYLSDKKRRCESFFVTARLAWGKITRGNVLGMSESDRLKLVLRSTKIQDAKLLQFWLDFLSINTEALCKKHYNEADIKSEINQFSYLAINIPSHLFIVYNYKALRGHSMVACTLLYPQTSYLQECEEMFFETIALHEVLSLVFPEDEGSFNYGLSAKYFFNEMKKL